MLYNYIYIYLFIFLYIFFFLGGGGLNYMILNLIAPTNIMGFNWAPKTTALRGKWVVFNIMY